MNRPTALPALLFAMFLPLATLQSAVIRVPQDEASIQDACDNASDGDTIRVSPGEWIEAILIIDKFLTIEGDTASPENHIVHPEGGGSAFEIEGDLAGQLILRGLTLTGGDGTMLGNVSVGGGLSCSARSDFPMLVEGCHIINNSADLGGACYSTQMHVLFKNCRLGINRAENGAAVYYIGEPTGSGPIGLVGTLIEGNVSAGPIITIVNVDQEFSLLNCTLTENQSDQYLLSFTGSPVSIVGSILWANSPAAILREGNNSSLFFRYSLVEQGRGAVRGRIDAWTGDMLAVSPQFVNPGEGDFSLGRNSPCIDHGYPYVVLDYDGTRSDMGAIPYLHTNTLQIECTAGGNPVENVRCLVSTPQGYAFEQTTDESGQSSSTGFPDNANPGYFAVTLLHPDYLDRRYEFTMLNDNDTTLLRYSLAPSEILCNPPVIEAAIGRGGQQITRRLSVTNQTGVPLRWSSTNLGELQMKHVYDVDIPGRVEGAAFDGEYFYLPNCYSESDRKIFVLNREGEVVSDFLQPNQGNNGIRDVEWDGEHLWGVGDNSLYKMNTRGDLLARWSTPVYVSTFAWDETNGWFWMTAAYNSIFRMDRQGNLIEPSIDRRVRTHFGLAWYGGGGDGYSLFILTTPTASSERVVVKMNPETQDTVLVGKVAIGPGNQAGYGLNVTTLLNRDESPVWLVQTIDSTDREPDLSFTTFEQNPELVWMRPMQIGGEIGIDQTTSIDLAFSSISPDGSDTLDMGIYEGTFNLMFDVPSETVEIPVVFEVGDSHVPTVSVVPSTVELEAPYPNPFNSTARLRFSLTTGSRARLSILDLTGREVARLFDGVIGPGDYSNIWNGQTYPAGLYFARLQTTDAVRTVKLFLLK